MNAETSTPIEGLDTFLTNLIAKKEGISPEEVTIEYIHEQREKKIYPNTRYECGSGLTSYTRKELEEIQEKVDAEMEAILIG